MTSFISSDLFQCKFICVMQKPPTLDLVCLSKPDGRKGLLLDIYTAANATLYYCTNHNVMDECFPF